MGAACINPSVLAAASNAASNTSKASGAGAAAGVDTAMSDPSIVSAGKSSSAPALATGETRTSFKLLKTRSIRSVSLVQTAVGAAANGSSQLSGLARVNLTQVENRERVASADSEKRYNRIGRGVGREGQMVFDALDKT